MTFQQFTPITLWRHRQRGHLFSLLCRRAKYQCITGTLCPVTQTEVDLDQQRHLESLGCGVERDALQVRAV